ncbi:MAG: LytTR family DNA-binding domain-containing protein [Balneolaceae bacterium]|nr:LytTR family DNA-binding domain-containing protein [Balneolaceae bacterium]
MKLGQRLLPVNDREVAYFQASDKLVMLVTHEGRKYVVDYTLTELEGLLDPRQFFRLNRQFIASLDAISELESYFKGQVTVNLVPDPDGEDQVVISRRRTPELKSWLGQD